jgi:hypothetical protein
MHYRKEVLKKLPRESNTTNYHYVYHYHYEWIAGCPHAEMNTDTVPVCHKKKKSHEEQLLLLAMNRPRPMKDW